MDTYIFDIKRYAINDGPGIRTTIFMKGCPLRCVWCHNSESWSAEPQVLFKQSKCIRCGTCNEPGFTVDDCPTTARELCGRKYTMDELMAEIEKERDIMADSGGGVTLCGGEPLMHPDDALAILRELKRRGFHRTLDTALYARPEVVDAVAAECELLLVDLKLMDSEKHRRYTGVGNELILENIRRVAMAGKDFRIRIPLIEGINADDENMRINTINVIDNNMGIQKLLCQNKNPTINIIKINNSNNDKSNVNNFIIKSNKINYSKKDIINNNTRNNKKSVNLN